MPGASDALGERFRAAREARGLSLSDVAEQIRIRSVYLAAIEEENWNAIGVPVYVRGFLRTYARFVGIDPEEAVAAFNRTQPQPPPQAGAAREAAEGDSTRARQGSPLIWIAAAVAVVLIAFVVYNELTMRRPVTDATVAVAERHRVALGCRVGYADACPEAADRPGGRRQLAGPRALRPLVAQGHR